MLWPRLAEGMVARGLAPDPAILFVSCVASPAIGLILWYFIARQGSVIAKWIMTALVAMAVAISLYALTKPIPVQGRSMLALAGLTELLKVFAVTRLFTADARGWFARREAA
jgi:hypothetical protein